MSNITDKIKTVEDAFKATGRPQLDFENVPEDMREYVKAQYEASVVAEAINEDWKADWSDDNQKKYFPWFYNSGGGFVFGDAYCHDSDADAGCASRLCFQDRERAAYFGTHFLELNVKILEK